MEDTDIWHKSVGPHGKGILNVECAVSPPFSNCSATADVAHIIGVFFRIFSSDLIAFMVEVFSIPLGASRNNLERIFAVLSTPRSNLTRTHHPQRFYGS